MTVSRTGVARSRRAVTSPGFFAALVCAFVAGAIASIGVAGTVEITVLDKSTGTKTPARVHLKDSAGKPVRANDLPFFRDHFVCPGKARLNLPVGGYSFEVERGPEYGWQTGLLAFSPGSRGLVKIPTTSLGMYASRCDSSHTRGASALDPSGLLVPFRKNAPASEDPSICPA